jgi:nucleoside 2-deoxyribosyltransferase
MNIYFSCSITGGRQDQQVYHAIVELLLEAGHQVPTAHLSRADVMEKETTIDPAEVYHRDVNWVLGCDALIAEVSTPSHGVGYEIALALLKQKPVLCCYQHTRRVSKMITGNDSPTLTLCAYHSLEDLLPAITVFLQKIGR